MEPGVPCRACDQCLSGRYNLCIDMRCLATPPVDGDLARYHVHAADFCYKWVAVVAMSWCYDLRRLLWFFASCRECVNYLIYNLSAQYSYETDD